MCWRSTRETTHYNVTSISLYKQNYEHLAPLDVHAFPITHRRPTIGGGTRFPWLISSLTCAPVSRTICTLLGGLFSMPNLTGQDYPLNLSILISGEKEPNKYSPSNGEWSGMSSIDAIKLYRGQRLQPVHIILDIINIYRGCSVYICWRVAWHDCWKQILC